MALVLFFSMTVAQKGQCKMALACKALAMAHPLALLQVRRGSTAALTRVRAAVNRVRKVLAAMVSVKMVAAAVNRVRTRVQTLMCHSSRLPAAKRHTNHLCFSCRLRRAAAEPILLGRWCVCLFVCAHIACVCLIVCVKRSSASACVFSLDKMLDTDSTLCTW